MDGVTFNNTHSSTWGLFLSSTDIDKPTPKTAYIDIPFGDGSADLTEASGEVKYASRAVNMRFQYVSTSALFETLMTALANELQGQKVKIVFDKDPTYYYYGRLNISYSKKGVLGEIIVEAICDPYKYKLALTTQTETVTLVAGVNGTNLISNGDFSDGITGWSQTLSTLTVVGGKVNIAKNTSIGTSQAVTITNTHKYFVKIADVETDMSDVYFYAGSSFARLDNVGYSLVYTATADQTAITLGRAGYVDGSYLKFDNVMLLDLTASYGAGNEPTAAQMNTLLTKFANSWFNGTQALTTAVTNKTVTITNDRKKAFPKLTTTSATTILVDGVTYSYGTVTDLQTTIPLVEGANTLLCTPASSGNITFEWQEGAL